MKNFYNHRLLLLFCLILSLGFITSCEDDDEETGPNSGQVELLSFGPTGVQHGEELRFVGHNLNQVEAIELQGATVPKASFIEQTSELIRIMVPEEAMQGRVTLKLSKGDDVVSKTILSFTVPITVTSFTPEARPGANMTVAGTKLTWVEGVVFGRDTVDEFVSQSATELVLQVPMNAKTGPLVFVGGGENPTFIETEEEFVVTLPSVTSFDPASVKHSASVTLKGTNLDLVEEVKFPGGATVSEFANHTATEITLVVPNSAVSGALTLVATGSLAEKATEPELNIILPAITSLTDVKHGENLTITGTNLDMVKEVVFAGGEKASTFVSKSANQLVVKVPDKANAGNLKLVTIHGFEVATSSAFNLVLPAVTNVTSTPVDPGANITITGTNLDLVKSVVFTGDATVSTFVSKSANQLIVTVPNNAKSGVLKLITTKDYEVTTKAEVEIVLPKVTGITPAPVAFGAYLTINGSSLNLVQSVKFVGGATVTNFLAKTETQIILAVPNGAKSGKLMLITNRGLEIETTQEAQVGAGGPNIDYYIYDNALRVNAAGEAEWEKWGGWETPTQDLANTEQPNRGARAIKVVYEGANGGLQFHPKDANVLNGYRTLVLYVRGTKDSQLAVQVKNSAGANQADVTFDVKAGEYKLIEIPISQLGAVSGGITELIIKNYGTTPNTVYIDDIGLRE
ncbi:IPT/TIG domain-containing protein [Pontibacter rugosus]|uniref:IPT/TIG domain-containing protein n=1 Tax=Pontibacter rugosus TaxID=1745966 RepID=A0ABW3SSV8_9BACT